MNLGVEHLRTSRCSTQLHSVRPSNNLEGIEKEQAGIALLQQLKHLDSMDYDKNPIGLMTFYSFDSAGINLNYVQFQCAEYGIGWSVEIDSFLNAQNKELGIMIQQKMFKEK